MTITHDLAKQFEELVAEIQTELSPHAIVTLNDKILGKDSKSMCQIDITVRQRIGASEILMGIECKNLNKPLDVADVRTIWAQHQETHVNQTVIVSANGYSKAALEYCRNKNIDALMVADTRDHNWKRIVHIPIIVKIDEIQSIRVGFSFYSKLECDPLPYATSETLKLNMYDKDKNLLGTIYDLIINSPNLSGLEAGAPLRIEPDRDIYFLSANNYHLAEIIAYLSINTHYYRYKIPLYKASGFINVDKNVFTGQSGFEFEIDLLEIQKNGVLISQEDVHTQNVNFLLRVMSAPELPD